MTSCCITRASRTQENKSITPHAGAHRPEDRNTNCKHKAQECCEPNGSVRTGVLPCSIFERGRRTGSN